MPKATEQNTTLYVIIDSRTGERASGALKSRKAARNRADRMDSDHGAVRFIVRPIF